MTFADLPTSYPALAGLGFHSTILILKMVSFSFVIGYFRGKKKAFANPEDFALATGIKDPKKQILKLDEDVERVRRIHLNDLENIPAFIFVGAFYVLTRPNLALAFWHFRIYTATRMLHTLSYQMALQPARALAHIIGALVLLSMGVQVLMAFC